MLIGGHGPRRWEGSTPGPPQASGFPRSLPGISGQEAFLQGQSGTLGAEDPSEELTEVHVSVRDAPTEAGGRTGRITMALLAVSHSRQPAISLPRTSGSKRPRVRVAVRTSLPRLTSFLRKGR